MHDSTGWCQEGHRTTTTVSWPFVRDDRGEPVPEETFTHPPSYHPIFISFFHLLRSTASSLFKERKGIQPNISLAPITASCGDVSFCHHHVVSCNRCFTPKSARQTVHLHTSAVARCNLIQPFASWMTWRTGSHPGEISV